MSLSILIIGLILITIITFHFSKDLLYPGFLFPIPWVVFLIVMRTSDLDYNPDSACYLYFLLGSFIFELGCFIGLKRYRRNKRLEKSKYIFYVNYEALNILLVFEIIFSLYVLYSYISFIRGNRAVNAFLSVYLNRQDFSGYQLISYGRNLVLALGISEIIGYSHVSENQKKKYRIYMIMQLVICLILAITRLTRNGILFGTLPLFVAVIIVFRLKNRTVWRLAIIGVVAFVLLFSVVSIMKYYYLFSNGNTVKEIWNQIVSYGSGGFVAFQKQFDSKGFPQTNGGNTFRFILAVVDSLKGTSYAPRLEQQFVAIGSGHTSNVYTFYHWYVSDFGLIYGLFIQFLIGILHGTTYRKMSCQKMYGIYVYCILMYPLFMQLFQDQYISLTSIWLQLIMYGIIFLNTNVLFKRTRDSHGLRLYINDI